MIKYLTCLNNVSSGWHIQYIHPIYPMFRLIISSDILNLFYFFFALKFDQIFEKNTNWFQTIIIIHVFVSFFFFLFVSENNCFFFLFICLLFNLIHICLKYCFLYGFFNFRGASCVYVSSCVEKGEWDLLHVYTLLQSICLIFE